MRRPSYFMSRRPVQNPLSKEVKRQNFIRKRWRFGESAKWADRPITYTTEIALLPILVRAGLALVKKTDLRSNLRKQTTWCAPHRAQQAVLLLHKHGYDADQIVEILTDGPNEYKKHEALFMLAQ